MLSIQLKNNGMDVMMREMKLRVGDRNSQGISIVCGGEKEKKKNGKRLHYRQQMTSPAPGSKKLENLVT